MLNIVDCDVGFLSTVPLPALPRNRVQVAAIEKPLRLLTGGAPPDTESRATARYRQTALCTSRSTTLFLTVQKARARMAREANRDMPTTRASAAVGDSKLLVGHSRLRLWRRR